MPWIVTLRKMNKAWAITVPNFRLHYKIIIIKTWWYWHKTQRLTSVDQNRQPRNKSTCIWSTNLWQSKQEYEVKCWLLSYVMAWTIACQTPLSMEFSRQEHWSEQPFLSIVVLSDPGFKLGSPALQANSLLSKPPDKQEYIIQNI